MEKRKKHHPVHGGLTGELFEASMYNVYWVWSMVAFVLFGNMDDAQRIMQETAAKLPEHERLARKAILRVFSDIAADPSKHVKTLLQSSFYYEQDKGQNDFRLTQKLLGHLRERHLMTPEELQDWERELELTGKS